MNLTEWAKAQGVHPHTAYRWFREGILPVPATRVGPRTILVNVEAAGGGPESATAVGLYARVSSHDQESDLERQVARLSAWAARAGLRVVRVEAEVGSGMNGRPVQGPASACRPRGEPRGGGTPRPPGSAEHR